MNNATTSCQRVTECFPIVTMFLFLSLAFPAMGGSFGVQCPSATTAHPTGDGIKCQQISGGDGFATMGDGTQTYLFAFGPLSGLANIVKGLPGTQPASVFNVDSTDRTDLTSGAPYPGYTFNGAVGIVPDPESIPVANQLNGHVDPRIIMDVGVLNGSSPAPLMAIDEDDEFFLTLTNVGMIMRPDLFEQHTVHFHGYANASAFYDGVPDASAAINIGGSFTYYYLAPDAGTYFWHCHITPPEHLQMGMVGQLYVRPRQDKVGTIATPVNLRTAQSAYEGPANVALLTSTSVSAAAKTAEYERLRKSCNGELLCPAPVPAVDTGATNNGTKKYAYNDGDGSTAYDVEYPLQLHGFDPNFHFVGMTFNPESFVDLKDKHFLMNGRSYPDTINPAPLSTQSSDGLPRFSQPMSAIINIPVGGKALLRISDLNVTEFHTLASLGIPMRVVGMNARLLRDQDGNNMAYDTNSITLGGGESIDVILDASNPKYTVGQKFYLYTPQLDHLSNDAENFGGMMTEVNIVASI